jgi:acetyltransferase-like isoleucine patch superfamily enzyme
MWAEAKVQNEETTSYLERKDESLNFTRFWRRFWQMEGLERRETIMGVLRFYLRSNLFDTKEPVVLGPGHTIIKCKPARLEVGRGVRLAGGNVLVIGTGRAPARLSIGPRTIVGWDTRIMAATEVRIGARCMVSWNCNIFDSIGHRLWLVESGESEIEAPITIGDDVLIGPHSIIMKGVTIGNNSVIGAGSVVRKDVPPNSLVYGNPARRVATVERWER